MSAAHPWQLTAEEWTRRREEVRPGHALSKATCKDKSQALRNAAEVEWLIYGVRDEEIARLCAAMNGEIEISPEEAAELADIISTPVQYRDVIAKARKQGLVA